MSLIEFPKTIFEPFNLLIAIFAIIALILLIITKASTDSIKKNFDESGGKQLKKWVYYLAEICYSVFLTFISLFPLLGMFGTVMALITLDMSSGVTEEMQSNFFSALTSTAWGIISSVVFKIVNSCVQPYIENQIERARKQLHILGDKNESEKT